MGAIVSKLKDTQSSLILFCFMVLIFHAKALLDRLCSSPQLHTCAQSFTCVQCIGRHQTFALFSLNQKWIFFAVMYVTSAVSNWTESRKKFRIFRTALWYRSIYVLLNLFREKLLTLISPCGNLFITKLMLLISLFALVNLGTGYEALPSSKQK